MVIQEKRMLKHSRLTKIVFMGIVLQLAVFFLVFGFLHTEKKLEIDKTCPICDFQKTSHFFLGLNPFLPLLIILLILIYKLLLLENKNKSSLFHHILGQRAPPL
jgi:hypothetical protein